MINNNFSTKNRIKTFLLFLRSSVKKTVLTKLQRQTNNLSKINLFSIFRDLSELFLKNSFFAK